MIYWELDTKINQHVYLKGTVEHVARCIYAFLSTHTAMRARIILRGVGYQPDAPTLYWVCFHLAFLFDGNREGHIVTREQACVTVSSQPSVAFCPLLLSWTQSTCHSLNSRPNKLVRAKLHNNAHLSIELHCRHSQGPFSKIKSRWASSSLRIMNP